MEEILPLPGAQNPSSSFRNVTRNHPPHPIQDKEFHKHTPTKSSQEFAPPPPPGMRDSSGLFPGDASAGPAPNFGQPGPNPRQQRQPLTSTTLVNITPQMVLDEHKSRRRLTSYAAYTIKKAVPVHPKDTPTWARAEVTEERLPQEEISKQIKKLNEARGGLAVADKKMMLAPNQQGQICHVLDQLNRKESDLNFEWSLSQIDKEERVILVKHTSKRETTTLTVYAMRAPRNGVNTTMLHHNIERQRMERLQQQTRPPQNPAGTGRLFIGTNLADTESDGNFVSTDIEKQDMWVPSTRNDKKRLDSGGLLKSTMPSSLSAYEKVIKNGRKVLRIILKGVEYLACPDTGSDKNIMSKEFAEEHKFRIRCGKKDKKRFELGSGAYIESIGRTRLPCSLAKLSGSGRKQWFHVLADSIVPLIIGLPLLEETQVLTKNRGLLERCPHDLGMYCSLKFIGTPRKRSGIGISMNGRILIATRDTGSDLNLISLACAEREKFHINKGQEGRVSLENADGSITKTVGRVYVASLSLDLRLEQTAIEKDDTDYSHGEIEDDDIPGIPSDDGETAESQGEVFYVVKGLPCDVILGGDLLDRTDAFNRGTEMLSQIPEAEQNIFGLKIFKMKSPWQCLFSKPKARPPNITPAETAQRDHYDKYRIERFRRSEEERRIGNLVKSQQARERALELSRIEDFNKLHVGCRYCLSTPG
jgi:hypothetical protein